MSVKQLRRWAAGYARGYRDGLRDRRVLREECTRLELQVLDLEDQVEEARSRALHAGGGPRLDGAYVCDRCGTRGYYSCSAGYFCGPDCAAAAETEAAVAKLDASSAQPTGDVAGPPAGTVLARVLESLGPDWTRQSDIVAATDLKAGSVTTALQTLVCRGLVEATGATKARRYRRATSPSPAGPSPAISRRTSSEMEPPEPEAGPEASTPATAPAHTPPAGEEPPKPAPPAVSARVRKQLERDAAAAALVDELGGPPAPDPAHRATANAARVARAEAPTLADLVLRQLALEDEAVSAKHIARALFRNQAEVVCALHNLANRGRVTSHRSDGITLYGKAAG